jgi:prevent-host-death family protein
MRTISAGEFKAKCLALMDEVYAGGETIVITKRGKPVAQLSSPAEAAEPKQESIFGFMRGHGTAKGDIVGPIIPEEEWSHLQVDADRFAAK